MDSETMQRLKIAARLPDVNGRTGQPWTPEEVIDRVLVQLGGYWALIDTGKDQK